MRRSKSCIHFFLVCFCFINWIYFETIAEKNKQLKKIGQCCSDEPSVSLIQSRLSDFSTANEPLICGQTLPFGAKGTVGCTSRPSWVTACCGVFTELSARPVWSEAKTCCPPRRSLECRLFVAKLWASADGTAGTAAATSTSTSLVLFKRSL